MEITKNNITEQEAILVIKFEENDYKETVKNELKKIRKTANLKGYRRGNVPIEVIKKMHGNSIITQEVIKILDDKIKEYLEKEDINHLGELLPIDEQTKFEVGKSTDFQFAFKLAILPKIELSIEDLTIPEYIIKIEEKTIDNEITQLKKQHGTFVDSDKVSEDTQIRADLVELNENNTPKENGIISKDNLVVLDYIDEQTKNQLIDSKLEDKHTIDVKKAFKNETDLAALLKIKKEQLPEISPNFDLTIKKIEQRKDAELNQTLYDRLFGENKVKTEEEFKQKITENIKKRYEEETAIRFRFDLRYTLEKEIDLPLPEDFIVSWQLKNRKNTTEEQIRSELEDIKKIIKWDYILKHFSKKYDLQITQQDLINATKGNIIQSLLQMGLSTNMFTEEQLNQFAIQELEKLDESKKYSLTFTALEHKTLDGLHNKVKTEQKEITIEELNNIYEKENKQIADQNKEHKIEKDKPEEDKGQNN